MKMYEIIKLKREECGYTQEYVAGILNVTRQAVQNWETNKRAIPIELLPTYFKLLNINNLEVLSMFDLLDENDFQIKSIDYSMAEINKFELTEKNSILTNYPTLYLGVGQEKENYGNNQKMLAYVGEASSIVRRTREHLKSGEDKLNKIKNESASNIEKLYIIGHSMFNKSATLELEQMFMDYLLGDEKFRKLYNGRNNGLSVDFYGREIYRTTIFHEIWNELYKKHVVSSLKTIRNSALFANSPFKSLSIEQEKAKRTIGSEIAETLINGGKNKILKIQGLAGSGKTVLMSQLFFEIWQNPYKVLDDDKVLCHDSDIILLVRHEQQKRTYEQIAKKLNMGSGVVMDVSSFINRGKMVDILLVDEAHLLWSGNYGRVSNSKWEPDLVALHKLAKTLVLVYDPKQIVSERNRIENNDKLVELVYGMDTKTIYLEDQWRIQSSSATQQWIENLAHFNPNSLVTPPNDELYDIKFFADATEFRQNIVRQNIEKGLSRIVATYDWEYSQGSRPKVGKYWMVNFGSENLPWNLELPQVKKAQKKQIPWQEINESIGEVGSDFTVQGIDLNYVGVILGPSIIWNEETNSLDINADLSYDHLKIRKKSGSYNTKDNQAYLKNVVNVLLTRGVHGIYIYAVDEQLRQKLLTLNRTRF